MDNTAPSSPALAAALAAHRYGLGQARFADVGNDARGWLLQQLVAAPPQRGSELVSSADGLRQYAEFLRQQRLQRAPAAAASASPPSPSTFPSAPAAQAMAGEPAPALAAQASPATSPLTSTSLSTEQAFVLHFRQTAARDLRARLATAALSPQPLTERLVLFWANHFTVSVAKPSVRALAGAFEREALRPHIGGHFEDLLQAAVRHPAMLRYLDNDDSAGPDSAVVRRLARLAQQRPRARVAAAGADPSANAGTSSMTSSTASSPDAPAPQPRPPRISGLNENLAREVLELHTLGVSRGGAAYGGWGHYNQADVTAFAAVLTGWRVPVGELMADASATQASRFDPAWHQPGAKTVLAQRYAEGSEALTELLHHLAVHPNTARFVSYKLARHFVADEPAPALVARLEAAWLKTGGHLPSVMTALLQAPEAWLPQQAKLKTPEEFVISTVRLLGLGETAFERAADGGIAQLGQRVHAAPSPAGWSDRAADWLGPDAVWKRVEWATRVADRAGRRLDARVPAQDSLGPLLQPETARQIDRAADGPQALALLLMAPEFQRR